MPERTLEDEVEDLLIKLLNEKEIFHYKGKPEGLKGYPDRTVLADFEYHVEVKVGKELGSYYKQTPTQKWWQRMFEASNGKYVLLTGFEEVINWVKSIGFPKNREEIK